MYKITFKSQLFIVKELLGRATVLVIGLFLFVVIFLHGQEAGFIVKVSAPFYLLFELLPCIIIHYQYFKSNKDTIVSVNTVDRTMSIDEKGTLNSFRFDQIKSLRLALMADLYNGRNGGFGAYLLYHYAYIELYNGDNFIITCLIYNDLRKFFENIKIEVVRDLVFFPIDLPPKR